MPATPEACWDISRGCASGTRATPGQEVRLTPHPGRGARTVRRSSKPTLVKHVKGAMRWKTAFLLITLALSPGLAAQNYRVRTSVDLVVVPTSVRDGKGRLVTGLAQKDFAILEDGVPQTITNFSDDPQPLSAAIVIDTGMGGNA